MPLLEYNNSDKVSGIKDPRPGVDPSSRRASLSGGNKMVCFSVLCKAARSET